jgi:hypothetical protein
MSARSSSMFGHGPLTVASDRTPGRCVFLETEPVASVSLNKFTEHLRRVLLHGRQRDVSDEEGLERGVEEPLHSFAEFPPVMNEQYCSHRLENIRKYLPRR